MAGTGRWPDGGRFPLDDACLPLRCLVVFGLILQVKSHPLDICEDVSRTSQKHKSQVIFKIHSGRGLNAIDPSVSLVEKRRSS